MGACLAKHKDPYLILSDDVVIRILSFISYAPFEYDITSSREAERLMKEYNLGTSKFSRGLLKGKRKSVTPSRDTVSPSARELQSTSRISALHRFGTLTHVLPLVNKRFHSLCTDSNTLWKESIERLVGVGSLSRSNSSPSYLWEEGIKSFVASFDHTHGSSSSLAAIQDSPSDEECERLRSLIAWACALVRQHRRTLAGDTSMQGKSIRDGVARQVFQEVHLRHKVIQFPVLVLPYPARRNFPIDITLQQQYHGMIKELMAGRPSREQNGLPITPPRPRFLLACKSDSWRTIAACVVEVRKCKMRSSGSADITVVPVTWVLMERVSIKPDSRGLWEANVVRTPQRSSLPVFCLQSHLRLGQPKSLRLSEELHKNLITEVMESHTEGNAESRPTSPQFVYAHEMPLKEGNIVFVVEVQQFMRTTTASGTVVHVTVIPRQWVLVERLTARRPRGLFDATVIHLGSREA